MKIENLCINCMREMKSQTGVCEHCGFDERKYDFPQHHMRPFTILAGKYLIGKAIGEGGFGITYIGIDLELEARVAIKEYYPQGAAARDSRTNDGTVRSYSENTRTFFEEGREKFINEARTIAKFRELPEIVGVIEFFRENQTAYIVMEYLDGQTLKQYLKANGGKIPADELLCMMKPLISSLGKIHRQGLIHRDISPDNIMLMKDGSIKILDFGGARDFISQNGKSLSVMVKHGYAPEEQYRSHGDQGPWTDVYALCATMYRCITGKIPPEALDRLYQDELKQISSFGVNCPKYIEQAITKGLNVRKDGRYQSMEELYESLYKVQKKPEKVPKPEKKDQQKKKNKEEEQDSKQPDKKKKIMVAVAAVAVAAGVVVAAGVGMKMGQSDEKKVVAEVAVTPEATSKSKLTEIPEQKAKSEKTSSRMAEPTEISEQTPTPKATSTPAQEITQTASGVNIIKKNATYYVKEDVNVRSDCSAEAKLLTGATVGQELAATGISEDGDWIEIKMNGQTGYVSADLVSTTAPVKYHLEIGYDAEGSGDYSVGEQVKISAAEYFVVWLGGNFDKIELIKDIYSKDTTFIMPDHDAYVSDMILTQSTEVKNPNLYDEFGRTVIKLDGEKYTLPVSVQELESKGWECDFGDEEEIKAYPGYYVMGGTASKINEDGIPSYIYVTGKINDNKQIDIVGMKSCVYDNGQMELPGGINVENSRYKDVRNIYGEGGGSYYILGDVAVEIIYDDSTYDGEKRYDDQNENDMPIAEVTVIKLPENYTPPQN